MTTKYKKMKPALEVGLWKSAQQPPFVRVMVRSTKMYGRMSFKDITAGQVGDALEKHVMLTAGALAEHINEQCKDEYNPSEFTLLARDALNELKAEHKEIFGNSRLILPPRR